MLKKMLVAAHVLLASALYADIQVDMSVTQGEFKVEGKNIVIEGQEAVADFGQIKFVVLSKPQEDQELVAIELKMVAVDEEGNNTLLASHEQVAHWGETALFTLNGVDPVMTIAIAATRV